MSWFKDKFDPKKAAAIIANPVLAGNAIGLDELSGGSLGDTASELEGDWLGWKKEHQARKRQREAAAKLGQVETPELSEYGDLDLAEYEALADLVNYDPAKGEVFTAGDASTYEAEGYDPTYADFQSEGQVDLADSELAGINLDPATRDAQMAALGELSGLTTDGMTGAEQGRLDLINAKAGQQAKGARDALDMEMARRGISGSGLEMMGKQMANQSAAEAMRLQGLEAEQMAQQRQMQALGQISDLASGIRGQDYGIASDSARAQDAINAWNASNTQGVMGRNADRYGANSLANAGIANSAAQFGASANNAANQFNAGAQNQNAKFNASQQQAGSFANAGIQNSADQWRIGNQQQIANNNVGIQNDERHWNQIGKNTANNAVNQQNFGNEWQKATGQANQQNAIAGAEMAAGQSRKADTMNILNTGVKAAAAAYGGPAAATAVPSAGQGSNLLADKKKQDEFEKYRGV